MTDIVSWINKGQNQLPEWLQPQLSGRREANGSFMIHIRRGQQKLQARVLAGNIVIEHGGEIHTCPAGEVREYVAALDRESEPVPPVPPQYAMSRQEADVADMRDDTDDISRRIHASRPAAFAARLSAASELIPSKTPAPRVPAKSNFPAARKSPPAASKGKAAKPDRKRAFPPVLGARPTIEWLHLDRLTVDARYQRSTDNQASQRLITSIAAGFDWRLCTPLVVSRRPDGAFTIIDGQHRYLAARQRPDLPDLPCCVFTFDSLEEEAKMFVAMNRSRKAMNRLDDFHAAIVAGDSIAHRIKQLVTDAGLTIARNTSSSAWKPGEIAFTASIASTLRKHGDEIVAKALTSIAEAFPDQKVVHSGSIFPGMVKLLVSPPEAFDPDRMFQALLKYSAEEWGTFVTGLKGGDTRAAAIRDALLMAYEETPVEAVSI